MIQYRHIGNRVQNITSQVRPLIQHQHIIMKKKPIPVILGIVLFAVIVTFSWSRMKSRVDVTPPATFKKEVVRLAVAKALITAPVLLALHLDYFAEEGLEVLVTGEFSSGKGSFESMLAGNADISTPATTPVVFSSFERQDYSIFATYVTTYEGIKLVARTDRGINAAMDLKNKRIGMVPGTISQILLDMFLAYNKIMLNEVVIFGLKGHELPEALISGQVDAISVWEPHANNALYKLAGSGIQIPSSQVYRIAINMAVMNDYARKHPQVLEKVVRALIKATDFIKTNNQTAKKMISEILKMDESLISNYWKESVNTVSLDQLLLVTMENEAKWAIEHKITEIKNVPNYLNYINYQAMETVNPDLVTIIREVK